MPSPTNKTLSVVLAIHNEAEYLARCLDSVVGIADQLVIVDGESTDESVKIAESYKAKVIQTTNKAMFHTNKQMAIDAANSDWVLQLDADEVVDKEMYSHLQKLKQGQYEDFEGYYLRRKNYFLGTFLSKGGQYPDAVVRLFKLKKGYLPQKSVHEQIEVDGEIGWFEGHLLHYNAPTFSRYITNANRYTDLTAHSLLDAGVQMTLWNDLKYLLFLPKITFFRLFFRHRGYVDGFQGFVFALFSGLHHAIAYMKLGDLYREKVGA